jgi:D-3-phosphoglycerate dehydrogenase
LKVLITDAEYPDLRLEEQLLEEAGIDLAVAQCRTPEQVIEAGRDAEALLVQYAPVDRQVLEALPRLGIVSRYGVGVDTVDVGAAEELGVWVSNVPDYGVQEVATHAHAMALSLCRNLPFLDRAVRSGEWHYLSAGELQRPSSLTFGVVGLGRIGRAVAEHAGMTFGRVVGFDPFLPDDSWPPAVTRMSLEDLAAASNVISLHLPLTAETRHLFDAELLRRMPRASYLVNTSRGGLIDPDALHAGLDSGHIAGAGLDVLPTEPPSQDDPLLRHPRTLITPHAAFYSEQAIRELRRKAVQNIISWAREGRPDYYVGEAAGQPRG